jgi:hypothetical protein
MMSRNGRPDHGLSSRSRSFIAASSSSTPFVEPAFGGSSACKRWHFSLSRSDDKRIPNVAKAASARPSPPVREAQLHARQLILIGQAHVDAHLDVAVYPQRGSKGLFAKLTRIIYQTECVTLKKFEREWLAFFHTTMAGSSTPRPASRHSPRPFIIALRRLGKLDRLADGLSDWKEAATSI